MRSLLILPCVLALSSCLTIRDQFQSNGLARASFELNCPVDQIDAVLLNRPADSVYGGSDSLGAQIGVTGCDKRTVYVLGGDPKNQFSWSWLSNREVTRP